MISLKTRWTSYHEWYPMSDSQKAVLFDRTNGHYQNNLSVDDASGLLDQILDGSPMPTKELFDYTEKMRIPASYYYPEGRLVGHLLHDLKGRDNVAFRVYRLYCEKKGIRIQNLYDSEYKDVFYQFADRFPTQEELDQYVRDSWVIIDKRIIKDMEKQIYDYLQEKEII